MTGLTRVLGCNQADDTGMTLQGLSALVTEAMRDAHGKSVAVRLELRPHLRRMSHSILILVSSDNAFFAMCSMAWCDCMVFLASILGTVYRTAVECIAQMRCAKSASAGKARRCEAEPRCACRA